MDPTFPTYLLVCLEKVIVTSARQASKDEGEWRGHYRGAVHLPGDLRVRARGVLAGQWGPGLGFWVQGSSDRLSTRLTLILLIICAAWYHIWYYAFNYSLIEQNIPHGE